MTNCPLELCPGGAESIRDSRGCRLQRRSLNCAAYCDPVRCQASALRACSERGQCARWAASRRANSMLVSSVMQTICRSPGGATSRRGNWPSARRIDVASSAHLLPCANAGGAAARPQRSLRLTRSARRTSKHSGSCVSPPPAGACPRSGRWRRPRRRRSAGSRRGAPCSRAPAPERRCRPICRPWAGRRSP